MSERMKLFQIDVGVTETGVYSTSYLTLEGLAFAEASEDFKKLLDAVVAAVAQTLSNGAKAAGEVGKARSYGPGADVLAKALGEQGVDVEVVEAYEPSFMNDDLPIH